MDFIKQFNSRGATGFAISDGSLTLKNDKVTVRFPNYFCVVEKGIIEGGIGFVLKKTAPRKSPYTMVRVNVDLEDLPEELRVESYRFFIPATKLSDTDFAFLFCNAKVLNHK